MIENVWWVILYFYDLLRHCGWHSGHLMMHLMDLYSVMRKAALI